MKAALFSVMLDRGGILSCDQIGTVRLAGPKTIEVMVSRDNVNTHLMNVANTLRARLKDRGGRVRVRK